MMPIGAARAPYWGLSMTKPTSSAITCLSTSITTAPTAAPTSSGVRAGRMPPSRPSIRCTTRKFSTMVSTTASAPSSSLGPSHCRPSAVSSRSERLAVKLALTNDSSTSGASARNQPRAQTRTQTTFRVFSGAP